MWLCNFQKQVFSEMSQHKHIVFFHKKYFQSLNFGNFGIFITTVELI